MNASDSESPVSPDSATGAGSLLLRTLGEGQLLRRGAGGDEVVSHGANKSLALFTYLACAPGRGATRAHLQDLLWERQGPERAQGALRTYLWKLRTMLGANAIAGDEYVVLSVPCEVDRDQLTDAADRGDAEAVVALYTGDFFPAFTQPDSPQFDLWVQSERLRLRGIFSRCAERVVSTAINQGRFRDALVVARKLRDSDPMDEAGWRPLLDVLIASGDSINAANEAAVLERLLAADERTPQPTTAALLKAVARMSRAAPGADESPKTLVAPLVARDREFALLTTSWARARAQSFGHVHIRAPAGMGKTRLLDDFSARLQRDRGTVARARADMGRRDLPYAFIGAVVADLAGRRGAKGLSSGSASALLAINPALSSFFAGEPDGATGDEALRRRTLAFAELVAAISEEQPLALMLDDLQWADSASCAVLAAAMSSLSTTSCLIVTASREPLGQTFSASDSALILLAPLDVDAITELVLSLASLPDAEWANALPSLLQRTTAGVPLQLIDALTLAMERGVLARDGQCWRADAPQELEQLLTDGATLPKRVDALPDEERLLLLVLSVAGEPCAGQRLADVSRRALHAVDHSLSLLERSGFVTRSDDTRRVAHDAIADAVLTLMHTDDIKRVHADLALTMLRESRTPGGTNAALALRSAMLHAWRSHVDDVVRVVFGAYVHQTRASGDARALEHIAADVLNTFDAPDARAHLVALLPIETVGARRGARQWQLLAGAAAIAVVASVSGAWLATRQAAAVPDGELVLLRPATDGRATLSTLRFSSRDWPTSAPLIVDDATPGLTVSDDPMLLSAVPTGRRDGEWIGTMIQSDSGVTDLVRFLPGALPERLTFSRGDDLEPGMSPDGQQVVFSSAQWSREASRNLASLDLRTGTMTRVTSSRESDGTPVWSPDGRRIAFARTASEGTRLCTVTVDGRDVRCLDDSTSETVRPWAWQNDSVLIADISRRLVRVHVDSQTLVTIDSSLVERSVSFDGRWIASPARITAESATCAIASVDRPARGRSLQTRARVGIPCAEVRWSVADTTRRPFVTAVHIDRFATSPMVGAPHRFSAALVRSNGDSARTRALVWSSSDTAIAVFGKDGQLHPRDTGTVTIRASYGGWRFGEQRVRVRARLARPVMQETWEHGLTDRWSPFGDPAPRTVKTRDGVPAFLNNGDGVFQSGVHSTATMSIDDGLALETWLSTPITLDHWQVLRLGLYVGIDSSGLAQWDHRDGWAFAPGRQHTFPCEFYYPSGREGTNLFTTAFETATNHLPALATWKTGARFRLRLQILPDRRCGAAINGQVVAIGEVVAPAGRNAHVFIYGNSAQTQLLVGPTSVTAGVPPGVDWFAVKNFAAPRNATDRELRVDRRPRPSK